MTYQTELINTAPKISLKVAKRIRNYTHTHTHTPLINTTNTHQVHTHVRLILKSFKIQGSNSESLPETATVNVSVSFVSRFQC